MIDIIELKAELLRSFHAMISGQATEIAQRTLSRKKKAQAINSLCGALRTRLSEKVKSLRSENDPIIL